MTADVKQVTAKHHMGKKNPTACTSSGTQRTTHSLVLPFMDFLG